MKKILIADDQHGIRFLLNEVFKQDGYKTTLASNGVEALLRIEQDPPDCVLLDMKMPGLTGEEVLRQVKSQFPTMPVVFMTAYDKVESLHEEPNVQPDYYFTKPFDIHEVRDTIRQLIGET